MKNNSVALLLLVLPLTSCAAEAPSKAKRGVIRDFDSPAFNRARIGFLMPFFGAQSRMRMMHELVRRDAARARDLLASALDDSNADVRRKAAEWLAILGDPRGLEVQGRCIVTLKCRFPFEAARFLGIWRYAKYAAPLSEKVRATLEKGLRQDGKWWGTAEDRAFLEYGSIALARIGRVEDRDLIIRSVGSNPLIIGVEALGYVDDPRSREILWAAHKEWTRLAKVPSCSNGRFAVTALLALSRLGEPLAVERMKDILRGVGTPVGRWPEGGFPSLCVDRDQAFRLRPRDAASFAEVVFEIAGQNPEGPGTMEAWEALGVMHPQGFGERMLKLATSKRQWRLVDRQTLFEAIIAVDPSLGDKFWEAFDLTVAPAEKGLKTFVKAGVGHLMFSTASEWTGD